MHYTKAQYAQVLAARFWFLNNRIRIETIAEYWEISVDEVREIQESEEYRSAVKELMCTSQSPRNLLKWIESSPYAKPSMLAKRMGLPEEVVSEIIEQVEDWLKSRA